ncbi:phage tail protein [Streptococcus anginosus]|nr:phage tail protein [Streptococcus anginosus]MED5952794.1 phage tail protein [Streptococcus anginosus]MED5956830.1 phage tail protein [Streptococcus anginosus]
MQIIVHDNKLRKVALINNNYPDMLSFHSDSWHRYLLQATSTFDFTIPKLYNGRLHEDLGFISDKAYFSFKFQGKHHLFYIANITEDDFNIALKCNNTNLELVNEQSIPFTSNSAQNIAWYLQHMELLTFATLEIGVNEIADKTRTLTFESQETKLSRLQSLMSRFNAEFEFVTELNNNGTLKRIVLNIYHEADNEHHGIGKVRSDVVLRYGNDVKGVQVTTDKTQLFNTGVFTGADGLTLKDVERSDKDSKGNEEFYTRKGSVSVYAPLSMERYPASMKDGDNWTRKDFQTEYTNVNDLLAYAFRTIKQYAYPIVSYTASIQSSFLNDYQDLVLGDTVKIYDKNFVGGLILQARVTEQVISFSNPNNNTLTFSNYVKLDSKISDTLRNRMAEMIEARLPYTLKMSTSAGTSFKNGTGESIVTPELYKGQKKITDATYRYYFGSEMTTGQTYKVLANKIENKQVLTVAAYIGNDEVARDKLTFINVFDGKNGLKGDKGAIDEEKLKEIEQNINSKADNALTQEQLNALNEKNAIMQAEWEAKASLGTLNKAIAEYKSYTLQNNKDKAKSEKDLISLNQRLVENIRNLKELAERWNFLDKYFQVGNEGIVFGEQNGNTCAKMSNNRFSIFSAGTEVMYISQGTLFIENGIFSKSIQIGRFREEQYHLNLDMNVIRYVGGI